MERDLTDKCNNYIKSGKIDKFYDYIIQHNLKREFMQQAFSSTFDNTRKNEKEREAYNEKLNNISNFIFKLFEKDISDKYGKKLASRFVQILYNSQYPIKKIRDLYDLINLNINQLSETEQNIIYNIMDIASNEDKIIGTHITKGGNGNIYNEVGIPLSGHIHVSKENLENHLDLKLKRNITFYNENELINLALQPIKSRGYKQDRYYSEFTDVMIVSISKDKLEQNAEEEIIDNIKIYEEEYLKPNYIKGFIRVNVETGKIEEFVENQNFVEKEEKKDTVELLNTNEWREKFEKWYEASRTTKMQKLKNNVIGFFKNLLSKEKNTEWSLGE